MRKIISCLLVIVSITALYAQDSAAIYYTKAERLFILGNYIEADYSLDKSISFKPTDSAYIMKAHIARNGKVKMLSYIDTAIMLNPSMSNYIRRAFSRKEYTTAYDTSAVMVDIEIAIKLAPDSAEPYRRMAGELGATGKYEEALSYYNKAYSLDTNPCVRYFRGMFYRQHKKYKEALADLQASYACYAQLKEVLWAGMIADCMLHLGDTIRACAFLNSEAKLDGIGGGKDLYIKHCLNKRADIFYWQGLIDLSKREYKFAIHSFTKSIQASPSDSAYWQRGRCYRGDDNHPKAIADFDTAILLNPRNAEVYIDRGIRRGAIGDNKGAIADYDMAIKLNPALPSAYWLKAMMYGNDKQKKYDKAIEILSQGITTVPDNGNLYKYRGENYKSIKNYKAAIDDFTKALSLKAGFDELIYKGRAECKSAIGDIEGACEDWLKAASNGNKSAKEKYLKQCGL